MSLEPSRRSISPDSSGRDSPLPRQWRNQLGADDAPTDKHFRKYASGVERALALFDTTLQEWADYISFLNRLLKALQARPSNQKVIPAKAIVSKRLSQCLNPSLPSGVHQKALEVYSYIFSVIGKDGLSRDLPLYLPGLAPTLSFASLSVREPFLHLLEQYFLSLDPRSLRPAMKSIILAMLPGLEDETSEDFERTLKLLERFKKAIRPPAAHEITEIHALGDDFFWQCFFLASITGQGRRPGALAYLVRNLPKLGHQIVHDTHGIRDAQDGPSEASAKLTELVTFPEPGLLLRCFAAGLGDEQLLIQRGFLDLLVTHLPLHSKVLQDRVKAGDLELLMRAAVGVVIRRDMSLNRRLWTWLIGPDPVLDHEGVPDSPTSEQHFTHKTSYFEEFGLHHLTQAILGLIDSSADATTVERARPYRICLSLMDKWEVGGLVVPEVFLPVVDGVRKYKAKSPSKADFTEVLRSASVFFDGVESGLIYGVMVGLVVQALGPGKLTSDERADKLDLVEFMMTHFNVREEEMITIHAPLTALAILSIFESAKDGTSSNGSSHSATPRERALGLATKFMDMVPDRSFPIPGKTSDKDGNGPSDVVKKMPNSEHLKKIKEFYMHSQGNLDAAEPPFSPRSVGELLLQKSMALVSESLSDPDPDLDLGIRSRILMLVLMRARKYPVDSSSLLEAIHSCLSQPYRLPFTSFSAIIALANNLYSTDRITSARLSELVNPLVQHAWSFLASGEPKYHVETVRCLWQLQTALTPFNRDIEAAMSALIIKDNVPGTYAIRPAESGRSFCVLWTHTLQDQAHGPDRRTPKTPHHDLRNFPRLAGVDNFDVMLTRPLFLMLDSLLDERTQLFMTVKAWLHNMVGVDRLFEVFVSKLSELPFLQTVSGTGEAASFAQAVDFSADDDLDMCLYYLRTLSNIFRWAPDMFWYVLASAHVTIDDHQMHLQRIAGSEVDISLQEFFLQVCMRCMAGNNTPSEEHLKLRIAQLQRCALTVLHQILLSPYAERFSGLNIETILIDRLIRSLKGPDPYIQVLLLDVIYASLRIRDLAPVEIPAASPAVEKKMNFDRRGSKQSLVVETGSRPSPPPPSLLKCIQAGFTAASSRAVLDSWVRFLTECLPFYSGSIFQVLIPLVETLCTQIEKSFLELQALFREPENALGTTGNAPESTLIFLLNGLEHVLAEGHKQLLAEETRTQSIKSPEQPQSFFGSVVSGVFTSEAQQSRSATANDRLTVLLAFQDAVRMCFTIWSWGQGPQENLQDYSSAASFNYTSLRMRNRARRLLEHLFEAETMECLETVMEIWKSSLVGPDDSNAAQVLKLLPALDGSRPKHTMPAIFNAIYSRTNPGALEPSRKSTLTIELHDTDLVIFLVHYARSLEDDAMDEIWQDCIVFLKDLLGNPFPHRQILPSLLEFTAILGEKVDNTNFGDNRKMRRELGDLFLRLLTALFTTRPMNFDSSTVNVISPRPGEEKASSGPNARAPSVRSDDVVGILGSIVPILTTVLIEPDRVLAAAMTISTNVIGPCFKSRAFPESVSKSALGLLRELAKLPSNQKVWRKDVGDAFNDGRFFGSSLELVSGDWLDILRQWTVSDKERIITEILGRITAPTTAGIVFGVGATSARLEADRRTQLNLRRIATLVLAGQKDAFVTELPGIMDKVAELLSATATSSPSSSTRADVYMLLRALVLRVSPVHLTGLWPVVNAELHAAVSSVVSADNSTAAETYGNASVLQACKLLDLLVCLVPDDWQLAEWLFVTDTIDSVYRPPTQSLDSTVALVDELSEVLGSSSSGGAVVSSSALQGESAASLAAKSRVKRPLIGIPGGVGEDDMYASPGVLERREELVARVLRPFFGQLSIYAFESTYAMAPVDVKGCEEMVLRDLFDERGVVKAV